MVWAIYDGFERDGTRDKVPVAWFTSSDDAREFIGMKGEQ